MAPVRHEVAVGYIWVELLIAVSSTSLAMCAVHLRGSASALRTMARVSALHFVPGAETGLLDLVVGRSWVLQRSSADRTVRLAAARL